MTIIATILIVDDNVDFHLVATAALERTGYEVKSLYKGTGNSVCQVAADCDIILLDVDLPEHSGIEICNDLKRDIRCALIPVVLITGNADIEVLCKKSGADACL